MLGTQQPYQLMDWAFFAKAHGKEIDWLWLEGVLEKFQLVARPLPEHPYGLADREDGTSRQGASWRLLGGRESWDGHRGYRPRRGS